MEVRLADAEGVLALVGAGGEVAIAEQAVTIGEPAVEHLLAFRVRSNPGEEMRVRIGTTSDGSDMVDDFRALPGWHLVAFATNAANAYIQFWHSRATRVHIDDVSLLDATLVELPTPYGADNLFALKLAQSADVLYIAHPDHAPLRLERRGRWSRWTSPMGRIWMRMLEPRP